MSMGIPVPSKHISVLMCWQAAQKASAQLLDLVAVCLTTPYGEQNLSSPVIFQAKALISIWFSGHCKSGRAEGMAGRYIYLLKEESYFGCFMASDTMIAETGVIAIS